MSDEIKQKVQQQFGTYAQNYVSSPVHSSSYSLGRLIELLNVQPGQRALDVATGGGHVALGVAKAGGAVTASDLTPKMLVVARDFITQNVEQPVNFAQLDGQAIPLADGSLDIATCRIAPHHFPDVARFVREMARVVKPGGLVGIVDQIAPQQPEAAKYVNAFEELRDPSHVWEYPQADWEAFFEEAGLQITHREVCRNRLEFGWWVQMQNVPAETVTRLEVMLRQAPQAVADWLQPELPEHGPSYFSLWQVILIGVKR